MRESFFCTRERLTNDYSEVGEIVLGIIAKVNPHFGLAVDDYWNMTEDELLLMVKEFETYNRRVQSEIKKKSHA